MNFSDAQHYFAIHEWTLHEETFEHLNQDMWICKATSKQEGSFYLLYDNEKQLFFQVPEDAMQGLFRWANPEMERRMSIDEEGYVKDLGRHRMEHDETMQKLKETLTNAQGALKRAREMLPMQGYTQTYISTVLVEIEGQLKEMED